MVSSLFQKQNAPFIRLRGQSRAKIIKVGIFKMREKIGKMNIPFSEIYNEEDDVYYVSFKTSEPSYCMEVDDILVLELGVFTNLPTGFRILNFKKNRVQFINVGLLVKKIKETLHEITRPSLHDREIQVKRALAEVLA
jgi:hypothetical protein